MPGWSSPRAVLLRYWKSTVRLGLPGGVDSGIRRAGHHHGIMAHEEPDGAADAVGEFVGHTFIIGGCEPAHAEECSRRVSAPIGDGLIRAAEAPRRMCELDAGGRDDHSVMTQR